MDYILIDSVPNWLELLRKGHKVWLIKQKQMAEVEFPYEPPEPGLICGRIGIRYHAALESWFIDSDGKGIDGSLLMRPIKGNLPDNPPPLPDTSIRQILRTLERLEKRIAALEDSQPDIWAELKLNMPTPVDWCECGHLPDQHNHCSDDSSCLMDNCGCIYFTQGKPQRPQRLC